MTKETFERDLNKGKEVEEFILDMIRKSYPLAHRVCGKFTYYDIYIPEIQISIEVKCDEKSQETGNIVVEIEFNGKPSALSTTIADYWCWWDGAAVVWVTPDKIRECIKDYNLKPVEFVGKGDTKPKKAYLISRDILFNYSEKIHRPNG